MSALEGSVGPKAGRREWIGLGVIALPCLLYSMDLTVLNLALPSLSADLAPSSAQLLWIVDIYGFLVAGCLITMGTLGDRIGRRRLLMFGAAAFGAASVFAAFSPTAEVLIASRAVLGFAGATLAPSTLSLIRNMFLDPDERRTAIGVWISSYSVGAAIGPLIGGVLLEYFWWGSVFLIGVPVMLLLLVMGPILLPEFRDPAAGRLDIASAALSLICVLAVIYGLKHTAQEGPSWTAGAVIAFGLVVGLLFVRRQLHLRDPLIDLRLFRAPVFAAALATYTIGTFVAFGLYVFTSQYLQLVLELSPLEAGLWTVPFAVSFIVGSMLTPRIARHLRPALVLAGGLAFSALGFVLIAFVGDRSGLGLVVSGFVIYSLGLAPVFTLATDVIVGSAPPEQAGAAAAISEAGSEFGGAVGIAILGSIGIAIYRSAMRDVGATMPGDLMEAARSTLGGAVATAERLPPELAMQVLATARAAFTDSLRLTAVTSAILVIVAAIVTAVVMRPVRAVGGSTGTAEPGGSFAGP